MLPDAERFRRLVDGRLSGPLPALARAGLSLAEAPYGLAVGLRNWAYDRQILAIDRADVPVVSVGNLTLGGTGKTPLVAWLARHLLTKGWQPAIVSRGYGASHGQRSDEAAELGRLVPTVSHHADPRRIRAARAAIEAGATILILDDGFQHRRLDRDLDLIVIDATDPFGCNRLFPRGLLREPLRGLQRADAVILSRCDQVSAETRQQIYQRSCQLLKGRPLPWFETSHQPIQLRLADGTTAELETLAHQPVFGFAGIGNPEAFHRTLTELGGTVVGFTAYADHHPYNETDVADLARLARTAGAAYAVTTLKDLVKIPQQDLGGIPLAAIEIGMAFHSETKSLEELLAALG